MADGCVPVVLSPEPFSRAPSYLTQPAGRTVKAALVDAVAGGHLSADDLGRTVVYVDGLRLDREGTLDHVLAEGQVVNIVVEAEGGGGGGRKEIGQILMTIAVIAVSMWVGGPAGATALGSQLLARVAAAAILTLGQAATAALFAPDAESKVKTNERYALQAASNQYRPWAPFPLALGEVVAAPDFATKTYTQAQGDDVWIYGVLGVHYGPCAIADLKIGDTLVSSMGANDVRTAQHLTPGPRTFTIVANDVDQLDLQEELEATTGSATPVVRAGSSEGERFDFDFFLPGGLHFQKDDGRVLSASVTVTIRYRPIDEDGNPTGGGAWVAGNSFTLSSTTKEPLRVTRSLTLPLGRYEFEVKRSVKPDGNEKRRDEIGLTAIKAIAYRKPVTDETLSIIEFAVRATALNQGTLAPITCRVTPICETWSGTAWGAPAPTSNPSAVTRWLMTGPASARPLQPVQADARLRAWYDLCVEYDWKVGIYLTDDRRQSDVLALLEQAGRASMFWDGTQLAASVWVEKPAPRQMFTGSNLRDHRWTIVYPEPVHALRVEFQNIDEGGDPDELFVYADGYAETAGPGVEAATLIEALRLEGQKTAERAYRDGRWELGARKHRRRIDTWTVDVENLVSEYGDRVRLAWQRVEGGTSSRVRCRRWSGGLVSGVRLAHPVEMTPGESYAVDIRLASGVILAVPVINEADEAPLVTRELQFASPRAEAVSPKRGDLLAFGVPGRISEDVEILGRDPGEGLTANMTGVRYVAPLLIEGEAGPIPELQTRLTRERQANPPAPRLLGVQPEPSGIRVSFEMPPWAGSPIVGFPARWRPTPEADQETGWIPLQGLGAGGRVLVTPPIKALPVAPDDDEGRTLIDIEIRAVTESGQTSPEPLLVTGIEVREDPWPPVELTVTPAVRQGDDGASHGVLHVSALPLAAADGVDMIVEVRREPEVGEPGAWEPASKPLPAANPQGDLLGLLTGERYRTRAAWRSAGGWPSPWADGGLAIVPANSNVASDSVNLGGEPTEEVKGRITDAQDAADDAGEAAADVAEGLAQVPGLIDAAVADLDIELGALDLAIAGIETDLYDPATGLTVRVGDSEQATDALADRVEVVEIAIDTPDTGILARVADLQEVTLDLSEGKANAVDLEAVQVQANDLSGDVLDLQDVALDLAANKAEASDLEVVRARLNVNANRIVNPSGEDGLDGWSVAGPLTWVSDLHPVWGQWFTAYTYGVGAVADSFIYQDIAIAATSYTLSGWAYADTVSTWQHYVEFYNGETFLGSNTRAFRANGTNGPIVPWTFLAPAGATRARLYCYWSAPGNNQQVGFSRLKLEVGTAATPFTDDATTRTLAASVTNEAAARVSGDEANAAAIQVVAAQGGGANLLPASQFFEAGTPSNFTAISSEQGVPQVYTGDTTRAPNGEYAVVSFLGSGPASGNSVIMSDAVAVVSGQRYCISCYSAAQNTTTFLYAGYYDASLTYIGETPLGGTGDVPNNTGVASRSLGTWARPFRFFEAPANAAFVRVLWGRRPPVVAGAFSEAWCLRPMLSEATATQTEPPPWSGASLEASVTELSEATADLYGRTLARFAVGPAVPGADAIIFAQAELVPGQPPTSRAGIGGDVVGLYVPALDPNGDRSAGWRPVVTAYAGGVLIDGDLQATAQILLGTGAGWPVARSTKSFAVQHNVQLTFSPLGSVPRLDWVMDNLLPRAVGEEYVLGGNLTPTGFLPIIQIAVPATPSQITLTTDSAPGSGPTRQIERGSNGEAPSGNYTVSVTGNHTGTYFDGAEGDPVSYGGSASATVYARKAGTWQAVGSLGATTSGNATGTGFMKPRPFTIGWSATETIQMGSGVEAFGISFGSQSGGNGGSVTDLVQVTWTAQGSGSGTRAALAAGTTTTVRITPQ